MINLNCFLFGHIFYLDGFYQFYLILNSKIMGKFGFSFSLNRLLGITAAKQSFARKTGVPTTKGGVERKLGNLIIKSLFGKK
jgi:hypothetical protein